MFTFKIMLLCIWKLSNLICWFMQNFRVTGSRVKNNVEDCYRAFAKSYIRISQTSRIIENSNRRFLRISKFPKIMWYIHCAYLEEKNVKIFRYKNEYFSFNVQAVLRQIWKKRTLNRHGRNILCNSGLKDRF